MKKERRLGSARRGETEPRRAASFNLIMGAGGAAGALIWALGGDGGGGSGGCSATHLHSAALVWLAPLARCSARAAPKRRPG